MKTKTITIQDVHEDWLHENSVSLSRFVQKCIDKKMDDMTSPIVSGVPVLDFNELADLKRTNEMAGAQKIACASGRCEVQ